MPAVRIPPRRVAAVHEARAGAAGRGRSRRGSPRRPIHGACRPRRRASPTGRSVAGHWPSSGALRQPYAGRAARRDGALVAPRRSAVGRGPAARRWRTIASRIGRHSPFHRSAARPGVRAAPHRQDSKQAKRYDSHGYSPAGPASMRRAPIGTRKRPGWKCAIKRGTRHRCRVPVTRSPSGEPLTATGLTKMSRHQARRRDAWGWLVSVVQVLHGPQRTSYTLRCGRGSGRLC